MYAALTVRKLKPGTYDEWRKAWEPSAESWTEEWKKAYIVRNIENPDEIIAFGFYEGDIEKLRSDPKTREEVEKRFEAMKPYVESTGADGLYEVIEEVTAPTGVTAGVGTTTT